MTKSEPHLPAYRSAVITGLVLAAAACHSNGGSSDSDVSNQLTREAVTSLFAGNEDFAGMVGKLAQAVQRDPANQPARVFLATAQTLEFASSTLIGGTLGNLLERSGLVVTPGATSGSFWHLQLIATAHTQGKVIDGAPRAGELAQYLDGDLLPKLEALVTALEAAPADFSWLIPVTDLQQPLGGAVPGRTPNYELDCGDLRVLAAGLNVLIAHVRFLLGYDHANVDPNDFDPIDHPGLDSLAVVRDVYPNLGNVVSPAQLVQSRQRLQSAFADYQAAAQHIRNETSTQMAMGILTLAPDVFASAAQLAQFRLEEEAFRAWAEGIVNAFATNAAHLIDRDPQGNLLPPEDQIAINFFRLFEGVNLRDALFRVVSDPFAGRHRLGVTDLAQVDTAMLTAGGIVPSVAGTTVNAGDLQTENNLAIRIDGPPTSTKVIDGSHADWATGAVQIGMAPAATIAPATTDLGDVFVAIDAANLYVRIDADLQALLDAADFGNATLHVEWIQGSQVDFSQVQMIGNAPVQTFGTSGSPPVAAASVAGLEAALPIPAGTAETWARISLEFFAATGITTLENHRGQMLARVR